MIHLDSRVQRSSLPLVTSVDDGLMMMHLDNGKYYHLDPIGTEIWNLLEQPGSVDQICEGLKRRYETDIETIHRDVLDLLDALHAQRLIDVVPHPTGS